VKRKTHILEENFAVLAMRHHRRGRADQVLRQHLILRYIQTHRYTTLHILADHFKVSEKTIRRDVATLQAAECPIFVTKLDSDEVSTARYLRLEPGWCFCRRDG